MQARRLSAAEEHKLGGRIPCPLHDPLARPHPARLNSNGGHQESRTLRTSCLKAIRPETKLSRSISTGTTSFRTSRASSRRAPGRSLFISTTTETSSLCGTKTGRWSSRRRHRRACGSGRNPSPSCVPKAFDLRADPYERADITSNTYYDWFMSDAVGFFAASQPLIAEFLATFKEFPASQRPSSFSIDQIVENMREATRGGAIALGKRGWGRAVVPLLH